MCINIRRIEEGRGIGGKERGVVEELDRVFLVGFGKGGKEKFFCLRKKS